MAIENEVNLEGRKYSAYQLDRAVTLSKTLATLRELNELQKKHPGEDISIQWKNMDGEDISTHITPRLIFATYFTARSLRKDLAETGEDDTARDVWHRVMSMK